MLTTYWKLRLYHVNGGQGLNVFKELQTSLRQYQYFNALRKRSKKFELRGEEARATS